MEEFGTPAENPLKLPFPLKAKPHRARCPCAFPRRVCLSFQTADMRHDRGQSILKASVISLLTPLVTECRRLITKV